MSRQIETKLESHTHTNTNVLRTGFAVISKVLLFSVGLEAAGIYLFQKVLLPLHRQENATTLQIAASILPIVLVYSYYVAIRHRPISEKKE